MFSKKDKVRQMSRTSRKNAEKLEENHMLIKLKMRRILNEIDKKFSNLQDRDLLVKVDSTI